MAHTLHARHTRDTDTDTRATAVNTMAWFIAAHKRLFSGDTRRLAHKRLFFTIRATHARQRTNAYGDIRRSSPTPATHAVFSGSGNTRHCTLATTPCHTKTRPTHDPLSGRSTLHRHGLPRADRHTVRRSSAPP